MQSGGPILIAGWVTGNPSLICGRRVADKPFLKCPPIPKKPVCKTSTKDGWDAGTRVRSVCRARRASRLSFMGIREHGIQAPSPAPDLIPAEHHPRTYIGIGTVNGGTSWRRARAKPRSSCPKLPSPSALQVPEYTRSRAWCPSRSRTDVFGCRDLFSESVITWSLFPVPGLPTIRDLVDRKVFIQARKN
jgi:hypothetical protein